MVTPGEVKFFLAGVVVSIWSLMLMGVCGLGLYLVVARGPGPAPNPVPEPEPKPTPAVEVPADLMPLYRVLVKQPRYAEQWAHLMASMAKAVESGAVSVKTTGDILQWFEAIQPLWFSEAGVSPSGMDRQWNGYLAERFDATGPDNRTYLLKHISTDTLLSTLISCQLACETIVNHAR